MTTDFEFSAYELSAEIRKWIVSWGLLPQRVADAKKAIFMWKHETQCNAELSAASSLLALLGGLEEQLLTGTLRPSELSNVTPKLLQIEIAVKGTAPGGESSVVVCHAHSLINITIALDPQRLAYPLAKDCGLPVESFDQMLRPVSNLLLDIVEVEALAILAEQLEAVAGKSLKQPVVTSEITGGAWTIVAVEDSPEWLVLIEQVINHIRETLPPETQITFLSFSDAASAKSAIKQLDHVRTLLILDLGLPLEEGALPQFDAGRELLQYAGAERQIPVVVLTAPHNSLGDHLLAYGLGVSDYCLKGEDDRRQLTEAVTRKMAARPRRTLWVSNDGSREIQIDGHVVRLDPEPFDVLHAAATRRFRTLNTLEIQDVLEHAYGRDVRVTDVVAKIRTQIRESFRSVGQTIQPEEEILETFSRWGPNAPELDTDRNTAYRVVADVIKSKPASCRIANRVLIVEDDEEAWLRPVEHLLRYQGYEVATATSLEEGIEKAALFMPHAVCLDLCIPNQHGEVPAPEHGLVLVKRLSETFTDLKCVMLTSMAEDDVWRDQIVQLGVRPEDCISKSSDLRTIANRLVVHLWRAELEIQRQADQALPQVPYVPFLQLEANTADYGGETIAAVHVAGKRWMLSELEGRLLWLMANRPGRAVSKDEIWSTLWPIDSPDSSEELDETNALKQLVKRLRQRLQDWLPAGLRKAEKIELAKSILVNDGKDGYLLNARVEWLA